MEEESFKVRVDRVFGSLLQSSSSWTLSDAEIERKEWNRDKGDGDSDLSPIRCSSASAFNINNVLLSSSSSNKNQRQNENNENPREPLEDDLEDLDDDEEDDDGGKGKKDRSGEDYEREEWEIRNSIGLDCTLDNEDEEDEYDKVAVGRENAGDRVYMSDISDYGPSVNCHNELPVSFEEVKAAGRDPRANHLAARARLQEDEATGTFNVPQVHDEKMPDVVNSPVKATGDGVNMKSILKRKDNQADSKSKKRVRFDTDCKYFDNDKKESEKPEVTESMDATATVAKASNPPSENAPSIPDYIRNPSHYVCYTFDSSTSDDESNLRAYQDFCKTVSNPSAYLQLENAASPPKSVTFTPRKKAGGPSVMNDGSEVKQNREDTGIESVQKVICPVGIAAGEVQESTLSAMEEDDLETPNIERGNGFRKVDRKYRSKAISDDFSC